VHNPVRHQHRLLHLQLA